MFTFVLKGTQGGGEEGVTVLHAGKTIQEILHRYDDLEGQMALWIEEEYVPIDHDKYEFNNYRVMFKDGQIMHVDARTIKGAMSKTMNILGNAQQDYRDIESIIKERC